MKFEQEQVREFHIACMLEQHTVPYWPLEATQLLRIALIQEELEELIDAIEAKSMVDVADALGDLLYVVLGAGCAFGLNLEPIFHEVHRSNMTKVAGGYKRDDGKWMKPSTYEPPAIDKIIERQITSSDS